MQGGSDESERNQGYYYSQKENDIKEGQGLVHLLVALDRGEDPDITKHLLRISETDDLYCLPAGLPDANYARLLNFIDPSAWYREEKNPLRDLFDRLSTKLPFKPDVIFVDSRTGITSMGGPLPFDLADLAVVVFFPHPQALTATRALVRALLFAKTRRSRIESAVVGPSRQLLHKVTDWEKGEHTKTPYDKSIIRPRAFIQSLPPVSEQALNALSQEEFPELKELLDKLREIRRTPIDAEDLSGLEEEVSLAREVGLLGVYEGTDEKVERYQVPDIYRHALGLTRKGQA